jgi:hypothetical protein
MTGNAHAPGGTDDRGERRALDSIQTALGNSDPQLAALLDFFNRLELYERKPAHENLPAARSLPAHRHRGITGPRRASRPRGRPSLGQAMALTWLATTIALIAVALVLSHTAQPQPRAMGKGQTHGESPAARATPAAASIIPFYVP